MATLKATIQLVDDHHFIEIEIDDEKARIPISEDKPTAVKKAFNSLIARLKKGSFQIKLEGAGEDLFSQVAKEYIIQLNREVKEVYGEMKNYGLVES